MKTRYRLVRRGERNTYYCFDTVTKKRTSLETDSAKEAERLVAVKNEACRQPAMNLQIAQVYLQHSDPQFAKRTWQIVMDEIVRLKVGETKTRWLYATKEKALDAIRHRPLFQTTAEHFLRVLETTSVSGNVYLRRIHNFALGMHWIPWPILPKKQWPVIRYKEKRAITLEEHQKIVERERNLELKAFYRLLWHLGGSQTDIATLRAEDVDWNDRTIGYSRHKTRSCAILHFGEEVANVLNVLPRSGLLFPWLARLHERHRGKHFRKRCATVGIIGISLHSYRYAWAERAREVGYPERFAQEALGHNSVAVHRAYAKKAKVRVPSLEEFERKVLRLPALPMAAKQ